jgi:hypothetical protein
LWIRFTMMRIRILASEKKAQTLKKVLKGSYSIHFGLTSAN